MWALGTGWPAESTACTRRRSVSPAVTVRCAGVMTSRATGEGRSVDAGGCGVGADCSTAASRRVYWIMKILGRRRWKGRPVLGGRQRVLRKAYVDSGPRVVYGAGPWPLARSSVKLEAWDGDALHSRWLRARP